jgi:hypothetical protein
VLRDLARSLLPQFDSADVNGDGRINAGEAIVFDTRFTLELFLQLTPGDSSEVTRDDLDAFVNSPVDTPSGCNVGKSGFQNTLREKLGEMFLFGLAVAVLLVMGRRK